MKDREIDKEIKFIERDKKITDLKKKRFVEEIKNGLGDEIKNSLNPNNKKKDNFIIRIFKKIFK